MLKEEIKLNNNVIEITPDKDGKLFITLYGTKYQIVVKNKKQNKEKDNKGVI